ncbi:MAG: AsmA family protein [Prevotellaceae bacterium]|jgi:hypothetical protein|nr:AsmA family protein [Prevotellaceae bacterium]
MKKTLKITGIIIGSLLALIILAAVLVPVLFKDQLVAKAKELVNDNINAKVDFKDVSLSIFKNFPDITISLKDITLVGIDEFEKDTLASITSFNASINIMSYLKNRVIDLKTVSIKEPHLHAIALENGKANWDIAKSDSTKTIAEVDTTLSSDFNIKLDKFEIINGIVLYQDIQEKMLVGLKNLNFLLKGNMSNDKTVLNVNVSADNVNFITSDGINFNNLTFGMNTKVDADLKDMIFTLKDNETKLGPIAFQINGGVKITGTKQENMDIDLTYVAKIESLNDLVKMAGSLIPESGKLTTKGSMALKGWVKGVYSEKSMPQVWAEMNVGDGYFKYSNLPEAISNIHVDVKALYDGNDDTKTAVDVNRFHFELAGNPFDVTANVRTPMTDANIKVMAKGKINFASLANALPMEGINLAGVLTADVRFAGLMSAIEKEQYDKLNVDGHANLQSLIVKSKDISMEISISNTDLQFTPRFVELKSFNGKMGKSDIQMQGRLENFINYVMKGEMLKGNLNVTSSYIDCNEIMAASVGDEHAAVKDTAASQLAVIVLPGDIDFTMNVKADKIIYDKLTLNNANGNVILRNGELIINNLNMGFAGGTMALTGKYKASDATKAVTGLNMELKNVEIASVLNSFEMFDKMLPVLKALSGKISFGFNFATDLDGTMSPVLTSLNALGAITADSVKITESDNFNKITSLLGYTNTSNVSKTLKTINANFAVKDGKVQITPFHVKLGGMSMMIGGQQGLDQIADFQIDMAVPAAQITGRANELMQQIGLKGTTSNTINVGIAVGGTITSPSFKLVAPKYMESKSIAEQATDQVKDLVKDKTNELLQSLIGSKKPAANDSTGQTKAATKDEKVNEAVNQLKNLLKKK